MRKQTVIVQAFIPFGIRLGVCYAILSLLGMNGKIDYFPGVESGKFPEKEFIREYDLTNRLFRLFVKFNIVESPCATRVRRKQEPLYRFRFSGYVKAWRIHSDRLRCVTRTIREAPDLSKYGDNIQGYVRECERRRKNNRRVFDEVIRIFGEYVND